MEKVLGKISKVKFGHVGYQEAMLGLQIYFEFGSSGTARDISAWDANMIKHDDHCKWSEKDRSKQYDTVMRKMSDLMAEAKISDIMDLKGVPVEITMDGFQMEDWRILTEVL